MSKKTLPLTADQLEQIIQTHPTPFHLYDERAIRENAHKFLETFSWNPGFKEYFAVKALPNPFILKILHAEGLGTDCSSLPELLLSEKCGIVGEEIMFSSNDTPREEFIKARELGAIINLDDIGHIPFLEKACGLPETLSFRYNPGKSKKSNLIMGSPEESKFGFTRDQIFEGFRIVRDKGVKRFGLHTFVASNELDPQFFVDTADMLFELAINLKKNDNIRVAFVNLSGGIGIPYRPDEKSVDLARIGRGVEKLYNNKIKAAGLDPLKIYMECGRMITGPYGYLISRVLHLKNIYKKYVGLDACMADLMRPGMYGAYHHITIVNKQDEPLEEVYDVTGSICEHSDKFAIDRKLPLVEAGDLIAIHDTGAHGHAMGFNYNGKLRPAELLLRENNEIVEIRRREGVDDYFSTLDFEKCGNFKV
jgi:diaminopimelate decarboxylase